MSCLQSHRRGRTRRLLAGRAGEAEEEAVEEHLLECDRCGARLREVIALAEGLRKLAREGSLRMVVSDAFLKRAAEEGLRVREYAPPPGGGVECTVTAEDDILIGRLAADLSGAKRVDLCICDERGVEQFRLADIPVHSGASSVDLPGVDHVREGHAQQQNDRASLVASMKQAASGCSATIPSTTRVRCLARAPGSEDKRNVTSSPAPRPASSRGPRSAASPGCPESSPAWAFHPR